MTGRVCSQPKEDDLSCCEHSPQKDLAAQSRIPDCQQVQRCQMNQQEAVEERQVEQRLETTLWHKEISDITPKTSDSIEIMAGACDKSELRDK